MIEINVIPIRLRKSCLRVRDLLTNNVTNHNNLTHCERIYMHIDCPKNGSSTVFVIFAERLMVSERSSNFQAIFRRFSFLSGSVFRRRSDEFVS